MSIILASLPAVAYSQSLDTIRYEATTPTPRSSGGGWSGGDGGSSSSCDDDDDSFGDELAGELFGYVFGMMFKGVVYGVSNIAFQYDDHIENSGDSEFFFAHYPYADGLDGYMFDEQLGVRPEKRGQSVWFEYGHDLDQIQRYSVKFLHENPDGWNFDGEWSFFSEELGTGNSDNLHIGDVNVLVPLIQTESVTAYWGGGVNWLVAGGDEEYGWNSTLKFNAFPRRPWILSGEFDFGELGSVHQVHTALSTGRNWKHGEVFIGYDYRKIGSTELHGPMLGGRLWW
jgi:hypothetical protein